MAGLINCRITRLVEAGILKDRPSGELIVAELMTLYNDPKRTDLMWKYGIDEDVLDERIRYTEVKNWIEYLVKPTVISKRLLN
jgi:GMP synthase (glutamine-hydrolysing)